jgi:hypothetical protein
LATGAPVRPALLHHMCACGSGWWLEETQARCADLQARFFLAQVRLMERQARCTFNCVGAPGDPQVRFFETITTPGAPGDLQVHLAWGYQRHHRRTFCDYVRSQGAPVERLHKPLVGATQGHISALTTKHPPAEIARKKSGIGVGCAPVSPALAAGLPLAVAEQDHQLRSAKQNRAEMLFFSDMPTCC